MAVLSVWALALTWAALCLVRQQPVLALAPLVAGAMGYAALLALEFALMLAVTGKEQQAIPSLIGAARAWLSELASTPKIFCWDQPFCSTQWPDHLPSGSPQSVGVLLVHGYVCNRGIWNGWMAELTRQNVPFIAMSLEPVFGSIEDYAEQIEAAASRLEACTGRPIVVVAHSMGGLAVRYWWCKQIQSNSDVDANSRVQRLITLGSPHHGTWLARFAFSRNAREMRAESMWLKSLASREPRAHRRLMTCFYSDHDNIVFPALSATLEEADNRKLDAVAHVAMVKHPAPWAELQRELKPVT